MFYYTELNINFSKLSNFKKVYSNSPSHSDNSLVFLIDPADQPKLDEALSELFTKHNIEDITVAYEMFYIISQHLLLYISKTEMIIEATACIEPLEFLKAYIEQVDLIKKQFRKEEEKVKRIEEAVFKVEFPGIKSTATLSNADKYVKMLYNVYKSGNLLTLQQYLLPYKDLPDLKSINEILEVNNRVYNYASITLIPELAFDLLNYINSYLPDKLSKKKYFFIFELLYLYGIFHLDPTEETQNFAVKNRFQLLDTVTNTYKTEFIETAIRNHRKTIRK